MGNRVRYALCIGLAAALLSACGGSSVPVATDNTFNNASPPKGHQTFKYTGKEQTFTVPSGVRRLTVVALGAEGGGATYYPSTDTAGRPGRVYAIIPVHPGDTLYVFVGGSGTDGGFNGGGSGGIRYDSGSSNGNPGGGASDVRAGGDKLQDRIIVAAGGGGAGQAILTYGTNYGGNGGGLIGQSGGGGSSSRGYSAGGGGGGTQSDGGSGGAGGGGTFYYGTAGTPGTSGLGGNGGNTSYRGYCAFAGAGGGGGGGYYGGGGGGGGSGYYYDCNQGGGGGGGSSYIEPNAIKSRTWTGWKRRGDGLVTFSWK